MTRRIGFQGSETSRAEVIVYSFGDEPGLGGFGLEKAVFDGPGKSGAPVLVHVETEKSLGVAAGSFTFDVKADALGREAVASLSTNDWVDISYTKHSRKTHKMRGQIEAIQKSSTVVNGATVEVLRVSGRDFGRIFDITPIWFDIITDGDNAPGALARILDIHAAFFGDPATTVEAFLSGFLKELRGVGRSNWELPPLMPSMIGATVDPLTGQPFGGYFIDNASFFDRDFLNYPYRIQPIGPGVFPSTDQRLWPFAMEWADLSLCECYTELLETYAGAVNVSPTEEESPKFGINGDILDYPDPMNDPEASRDLPISRTIMSVIFRDRPFPTFSRVGADGVRVEDVMDGPWFKRLKTYEVSRQQCTQIVTARNDIERKNAFYAAPRLFHEITGGFFDYNGPLWSPGDMQRHGFRRHDVTFDYLDPNGDILNLSFLYKQRLRDFHCMNHLFYSGTIGLGHGRPDMRVGQKLRITDGSPSTQETYYIEQVKDAWSLGPGVRTMLGVSRGFTGSDELLVDTLSQIVAKYRRPAPDTGVDEAQPEPNGPVEAPAEDSLENAERYAPYTAALTALLSAAVAHPLAVAAGADPTWAVPDNLEGQALHELIARESGGYIGRPNYTFKERARKYSEWAVIHAELRANQLTTVSSATGLGQLIVANVDTFYPNGRAGIGQASDEAVGMVRYIANRYTQPFEALAYHKANGSY